MIKLAMALAVASFTYGATGEWVKVSENSEIVFYLDKATIRKDGDFRRAWVMQDLKTRDTDGELSRRILDEYDCKNERWRILSISTHSQGMAKGDILVSSSYSGGWNEITPETAAETKLKMACSL